MPIVMKHDPDKKEDFFAYEVPDRDSLYECVASMQRTFLKYAKENGIKFSEAKSDEVILSRIAVRVDQRCEYYKIYHNNTYLSEIRQTALLAYWIIRYRPFRIKMDSNSVQWPNSIRINEYMAFHMILGIISESIHGKKNIKALVLSNEYRTRVMHAFKEHDLTKESFMLVAESLLETVS